MNDTTATPAADPRRTTVDVTLDEPITRGAQTITTITLRRPKSGELRGIDLAALLREMDYGAMEALLPRISTPTLTRADVAEIEPPDLVQLTTAVLLFFAPKAAMAELSLPA